MKDWIIYGVIIILIVLIYCIVTRIPKKEPFAVDTVLISEKETFVQNYNLIATTSIPALGPDVSITDESNLLTKKRSIVLPDTFVIKQMYFTNMFTTANNQENINIQTIRIAVKNSKLNTVEYVNFSDIIRVNDGIQSDIDKLTNFQKTTQRIDVTSSDNNKLYINNPVNIYGNELIGDEILFFSSTSIKEVMDYNIYGFQEKEKYKPFVYDKAKLLTSKLETAAGSETDITLRTSSSSLKGVVNTGKVPFVIYTMKLRNSIGSTNNTLFKLLFKNSYTNDTVVYPGPVDGQFIMPATGSTKLIFTSTLLATDITFLSTARPNLMSQITVDEIKGYDASVEDINRFKLEYAITDIRGSINPDEVCPAIDKFAESQLNSEIIIDAMDYQYKINNEKAKILSNKDNLLKLMEQQTEINRLGQVVDKIKSIQQQRDAQTGIQNALLLQKQMDEYSKLKEIMDSRIALRDKNTVDINIDVNRVKYEGFTA